MEKSKILYVDDEPGNLNSFRLLLRKKYEVVTAESGPEGLKYLNDNAVAVVISDYKMPEMTGIEFLKESKKNTAQNEIHTSHSFIR